MSAYKIDTTANQEEFYTAKEKYHQQLQSFFFPRSKAH